MIHNKSILYQDNTFPEYGYNMKLIYMYFFFVYINDAFIEKHNKDKKIFSALRDYVLVRALEHIWLSLSFCFMFFYCFFFHTAFCT